MLQYNNWTIEQNEWLPNEEDSIEQQLTFSNDYLCQTAHFEESGHPAKNRGIHQRQSAP